MDTDASLHLVDIDLPYVRLADGFEDRGTGQAHAADITDYDGLLRAVAAWLIARRRPLEADEQRFLRRVAELTPEKLGAFVSLPGHLGRDDAKGPAFASEEAADRVLRALTLAALHPEVPTDALLGRVDALASDPGPTPDTRPAALVLARVGQDWTVRGAG